jgi:hypothetical protein
LAVKTKEYRSYLVKAMGDLEYINVRWQLLFNQSDSKAGWREEWKVQVLEPLRALLDEATKVVPPSCYTEVQRLWIDALHWYIIAAEDALKGDRQAYMGRVVNGQLAHLAAVRLYVEREKACTE